MGGLGPGIGGAEYLIIAVAALLIVGPERLPMLLNKLGKMVARARNMANEFRASFDEMARQSELDELRKEVEALRRDQMVPLGAQAEETFRGIRDDLNRPISKPTAAPALDAPEGATSAAEPAPVASATEPKRAARAKPKSAATASKTSGATAGAKPAAKPRPTRKKAPVK